MRAKRRLAPLPPHCALEEISLAHSQHARPSSWPLSLLLYKFDSFLTLPFTKSHSNCNYNDFIFHKKCTICCFPLPREQNWAPSSILLLSSTFLKVFLCNPLSWNTILLFLFILNTLWKHLFLPLYPADSLCTIPNFFPHTSCACAEIYKYVFKADSASYNRVWFSGPLFNCLNLSQILFILKVLRQSERERSILFVIKVSAETTSSVSYWFTSSPKFFPSLPRYEICQKKREKQRNQK